MCDSSSTLVRGQHDPSKMNNGIERKNKIDQDKIAQFIVTRLPPHILSVGIVQSHPNHPINSIYTLSVLCFKHHGTLLSSSG